ncbi:valine--tRNA ligase [Labrys monachus]|uniref:Valine--tRNA ligase n=1 Tax=Labrys monachus TaxID=217067 RepID=A0ABU0FEI7_9HYPH|nr:valine--tRNA ligase [Labrys monachus]MDQ0393025.1 valyl-tRNA synthetase [Labrys monachus]
MIATTFDPASAEPRVSAAWDKAGAFRAGRPDRQNAAPYSIVIPPPNVTGSLHMGHALNNTLQDILCRFERMRGKDVLWQPGTDHAGIATQMVVERQLQERQIHRRDIGRAAFLEHVWAWKNESGGAIVNQLKRLGASCDWSRERFTMDEGLSKAVVEIFVRLHEAGLIYKDKRLVNWDPKLLTAISDLEVVQEERRGHLWHFAYPVVDEAGEETGETITVATTRPETMLGDTAVAVHPKDERYAHLVGRRVRLPLVGRLIPIVADDYSDPEKGTGAVKITPAHDFNDFEVGRRHDLEVINIFTAEAHLNENVPEAYRGLERFEARKRIVAEMEALGRLVQVEAHTHQVPHGDRSGVPIEPWLTDQWYVNVRPLADRALDAVRRGETRFVPQNWEKTFFDWLENIQPWCVSRQLWWGHQIPAWYGPDGDYVIARDEAEARAKADAKWGAGTAITRDEDVLDTWFSSALWPYSTFGWPDKTPELAKYYPTSVVVTGFDIIFFWVARMMMTGLFTMNEVPFRDVYIHALVRDEKGAKMSKSKGNVMDPLDIIDGIDLEPLVLKRTAALANKADVAHVTSETRKAYPNGIERYGADALRFFLAAMAAPGRDVKLSIDRVKGYRNFGTKLWNATRFAEMKGCVRDPSFDPKTARIALNRWIAGEAEKAAGEIQRAIEAYRFNDAAGAVYRFIWNVVCDWYVELAKPIIEGGDEAAARETQAMVAFILDQATLLLHPFMPFITEELWSVTAGAAPRETLAALTPWPDLGGFLDAAADEEIGWLVEIVTEIRSIRTEIGVPGGAQVPLVMVAATPAIEARVAGHGDTLKRLARISEISFAPAAPKGSIQVIARGATAALALEGIVDIAAEKARLVKEIGKVDGDIAKINAKLGNPDFIARAKEEVIEEQRERLEDAAARRAKMQDALAGL